MRLSSPPRISVESPFLRVSKPVTACSRCRRSKKKCDGKLPVCSACRKAGRANECSRDNEKVTKGSERNYVASLESRVEELEKKLAFARSRKDSLTAANVIDDPLESSDSQSSFTAILTAARGKAARRREAADLEELVSDFGFLSINATTQDFESTSTGMTFARLVLAAANNKPLSKCQPFRIPSKAVTIGLIDYYVKNILPLFPIFSEAELYGVLDTIYQDDPPPITEFEYWLFCMVLAVSSTSQSQNQNDKYYEDGVMWVGRAIQSADRVLVPGYVSQIQALVILVQYAIQDPSYFDSWILIGFACRAVVDLGFHQDPPKEEEIDQEALKFRRTVFYCVYSLDRSISMVHARPFSFTDDSINVTLPSPKPQWFSNLTDSPPVAEPVYTSIAVKLFKLRMIQSSWYQKLFQSNDAYQDSTMYVWQVCREMRLWAISFLDNIPDSFRELFEIELFYSYVYLFTPSCHSKVRSASEKKFIFEFSIQYIQKISSSLGNPAKRLFHTYHDALRVFFVGSQFLSVLLENQDQPLNALSSYSPSTQEFFPSSSLDLQTDNLDKSLNCIHQIKEVLRNFGCRWEDTKVLLSSLESQLENLPKSLQIKEGITA